MQHQTQMQVMGDYLLRFARSNELFLVDAEQVDDDARRRCCGG